MSAMVQNSKGGCAAIQGDWPENGANRNLAHFSKRSAKPCTWGAAAASSSTGWSSPAAEHKDSDTLERVHRGCQGRAGKGGAAPSGESA